MNDLKSYYEIFKEHEGLVSQRWSHYFFIYDLILQKFREKREPVNLLEIGVQNGGSLEIWKKYMPEGSQIYGIDINEKCCDLKFSDNIHFYLGDASNTNFTDEALENIRFDIILDDGSHQSQEVINSFIFLFPKLNSGGVYIIEDLEHSYWKKSGGGFRKKNSSIEFFKKIIDSLNFDYINMGKIEFFFNKKELNFLRKYSGYINNISFYPNICSINKYSIAKNEPFQCVKTGQIEEVIRLSWRKTINDLQHLIDLNKSMFE